MCLNIVDARRLGQSRYGKIEHRTRTSLVDKARYDGIFN